jgi:hypothetical protein
MTIFESLEWPVRPPMFSILSKSSDGQRGIAASPIRNVWIDNDSGDVGETHVAYFIGHYDLHEDSG